MKKLYLAAIAVSLLLSSCSKVFYQVYNTEAPGMVEDESSLVYENEDCRLLYNLWAEGGNAGFVIQNKTEKDLFLILSQTFFIKNGKAFDYFKNREYANTESIDYSSGITASGKFYDLVNIWGDWHKVPKGLSFKTGKVKGRSSTITTKEASVVCIPAHSYKFIKEYSISDRLIKTCDRRQLYPKRESRPVYFTKEDSPLSFKNRISYSFDKDGGALKHIENEFWISEVINYSKKKALDKKKYKECEGDYTEIIYVFNVASPKKFYNSFVKDKEY